MKKTFKNILAVAGVLGLTFALNAVKPQHISAAEKLPAQTTKELKEKGTLTCLLYTSDAADEVLLV